MCGKRLAPSSSADSGGATAVTGSGNGRADSKAQVPTSSSFSASPAGTPQAVQGPTQGPSSESTASRLAVQVASQQAVPVPPSPVPLSRVVTASGAVAGPVRGPSEPEPVDLVGNASSESDAEASPQALSVKFRYHPDSKRPFLVDFSFIAALRADPFDSSLMRMSPPGAWIHGTVGGLWRL